MVVRLDDPDLVAAAHPLFPADGRGQLELPGLLDLECCLQLGPLRAAGGVGEVGLVDRCRRVRDGVHAPIVSDPHRHAQVTYLPLGARWRVADVLSTSSSSASVTHCPSTSRSGMASRSLTSPKYTPPSYDVTPIDNA